MALDVENTAPPSTPTTVSQFLSSDAIANNESSPASSPPAFPWDLKEETNCINSSLNASPRNVFSVLGKRKIAALSGNAVNAAAKKVKKTDDGKTQMQLHLGQKIGKRCKECGMQYVISSNEDRSLHAKFHKQHTEGVDVGAGFADNAPAGKCCRVYDGVAAKDDDKIVVVDCFDKKPRRRKAQEAVEIVQRDLGAVEIAETEIWEPPIDDSQEPRYRSFLYIREGKCVGFLLTERITEAFEVMPPKTLRDEAARPNTPIEKPADKKNTSALEALKARKVAAEAARARREALLQAAAREPILLSKTKTPASLGICRIWTLPSHRGQGIAISLLDAVLHWQNDHIGLTEQNFPEKPRPKSGVQIRDGETPKTGMGNQSIKTLKRNGEKEHVAFSQPTSAGTRLARKWMGQMSGWKVYLD